MHSILVFMAGGIFGLLGGCVLSVGVYDKGYDDGSDSTYQAFTEEHERLRRETYEATTNDIHGILHPGSDSRDEDNKEGKSGL